METLKTHAGLSVESTNENRHWVRRNGADCPRSSCMSHICQSNHHDIIFHITFESKVMHMASCAHCSVHLLHLTSSDDNAQMLAHKLDLSF